MYAPNRYEDLSSYYDLSTYPVNLKISLALSAHSSKFRSCSDRKYDLVPIEDAIRVTSLAYSSLWWELSYRLDI